MRISAAFSTERLLHRASSHMTFRRSRAYCKAGQLRQRAELGRLHPNRVLRVPLCNRTLTRTTRSTSSYRCNNST